MWARFITTNYVALLFFAVLYHVYGDAPTANPVDECDYKAYLIAVSSVAGLIIFVMSVVIAILVKSLCSRKSREQALYSNDSVQPGNYGTIKDDEESDFHSNDPAQPGNYATFNDGKDSAKGSIDSLQSDSAKGSIDSLQSVPTQEEQPVSPEEVAEYAHTVTIRHCNKIFKVIKLHGRGQGVLINQKPYENEKVLFDTCQMIKDWLDRQECINYEKRRRLEAAVGSAQSVYSQHDEELFSAKLIKEKASGHKSKRVAVAYDLLMTDIKPFAKALDVEDSELEKYRVQSIDPQHVAKGTIGLVTLLFK